MNENYYSLYLSIVANYSVEQSLRMMGLIVASGGPGKQLFHKSRKLCYAKLS